MRKTLLAALIVTAASVLTVPAFAQDAAATKTAAGAAATDAAAKTGDTAQPAAHKATKQHSGHKAKAATDDASKTKADAGTPPSGK
ncbi:hypothetical protein [Dyella sp. RRB7]|uniref:hypothetical protein n=1 Tax=Dyella sp. RRB7 TaxID=2919502 RepID=UPI001FA9DECE|nr:hypothetical protein [Dyella sp. RRB7]